MRSVVGRATIAGLFLVACGAPPRPPPAPIPIEPPAEPTAIDALDGTAPLAVLWQAAPRGTITAVALDETGTRLATTSPGLTLLHDVPSGTIRAIGPGGQSVTPCGRELLLVRNASGLLRVWDLATDQTLEPPAAHTLAFSPSCRRAAAIERRSDAPAAFVVWDVAGRETRVSLPLSDAITRRRDDRMFALAWSPVGDRVAVLLTQPRGDRHHRPPPMFPGARAGLALLTIHGADDGTVRHEVVVELASTSAPALAWRQEGLFVVDGEQAIAIDGDRGTAGDRIPASELAPPAAPARIAAIAGGGAEVREEGASGPILRIPATPEPPAAARIAVLLDGAGILLASRRRIEAWTATGVRRLSCSDARVVTIDPLERPEQCPEPAQPYVRETRGALWRGAQQLEGSSGARLSALRSDSPDGAHVAALAPDELRVWSLASGARTVTSRGVSDILGWSPSGRHLVVLRDRVPVLVDPTGARADAPIGGAAGADQLDRFSEDETVVVLLAPREGQTEGEREVARRRVLHARVADGALLGAFDLEGGAARWLVGSEGHGVAGTTTRIVSIADGSVLASAELGTYVARSLDGRTLLTCSEARRVVVRDGLTLEPRRTLDLECSPYPRVSADGTLARLGDRIVRLADGAWIAPSTYEDEASVHRVALASSGVFWTTARDLDLLAVRAPGHVATATLSSGRDATRFLSPSLLDDFFSGRALPEPSERPREPTDVVEEPLPPPSPRAIEPGREARVAARSVRFWWEPEIPGATARVCADRECATVLADGLARRGAFERDTPGPLWWSVVVGGVATPPARIWLGPSGPLFETTTEPPSELGPPQSDEVSVRFRADGPTWTAQVVECEPFAASAEGDRGCAVVVLRAGDDVRHVLVDGGNAVHEAGLTVIRRPDGGAALLLMEARGVFHHSDTWSAHLVEDDGSGPRLALRTIIESCGGDDGGFGCGVLRGGGRYGDFDRDGDLDVEISYRGGARGARRFFREGRGFRRPVGHVEIEAAPSYGFPGSGGPDETECPWVAHDPSPPLHVRASPSARARVVGDLDDGTEVLIEAGRGDWVRISEPVAGWAWAASVVPDCDAE